MFDGRKMHLGIAPIGWTNDDMPQLGGEIPFEQCVSEAALAGFAGTEVGGKFPTDPVVLKRALELRGLCIASQWFSSFLCFDSIIFQEMNLLKNLTVAENMFLGRQPTTAFGGIDWRKMNADARALLDSINSDISEKAMVSTLSVG